MAEHEKSPPTFFFTRLVQYIQKKLLLIIGLVPNGDGQSWRASTEEVAVVVVVEGAKEG